MNRREMLATVGVAGLSLPFVGWGGWNLTPPLIRLESSGGELEIYRKDLQLFPSSDSTIFYNVILNHFLGGNGLFIMTNNPACEKILSSEKDSPLFYKGVSYPIHYADLSRRRYRGRCRIGCSLDQEPRLPLMIRDEKNRVLEDSHAFFVSTRLAPDGDHLFVDTNGNNLSPFLSSTRLFTEFRGRTYSCEFCDIIQNQYHALIEFLPTK